MNKQPLIKLLLCCLLFIISYDHHHYITDNYLNIGTAVVCLCVCLSLTLCVDGLLQLLGEGHSLSGVSPASVSPPSDKKIYIFQNWIDIWVLANLKKKKNHKTIIACVTCVFAMVTQKQCSMVASLSGLFN